MLKTILTSFRSPELRKKLLFTAFILAVYRFGSYVPVPGINLDALQAALDQRGSRLLDFLNLFAGGALTRFAVFALGIMPYITASIILQLMTVVIPALEKLQKEGESGQQKITQYTRYFTVVLALLQSMAYVLYFRSQDALPDFTPGRFYLIVISVTAGTVLLMWLGELITQRGVGNGISLLIFASIVSSVPDAARGWLDAAAGLAGADPGHRARRWSWAWSSSTRASAASRSSTPSAWWAVARPRAAPPTCRCA